MLCLRLTCRETISADMQRVRGIEQKLTAANGYHSGRHFWRTANGAKSLEVLIEPRKRLRWRKDPIWNWRAARNLYTAWKSRVLPAGDDRQEEASKRAGVPGKSYRGQSHTMMIYPLVSCGRSLKTVPWVKRCNRLPLLESGANLSALSSERRHRRCRLFQEDPLIFGINPINS